MKRIKEMLGRVALSDRANDYAETFSGGMQRRLEIAKGLLHQPSVLLLDEPTTGLDPGARRDLWQYLNIVARPGESRHRDHAPDGRGGAMRPAGDPEPRSAGGARHADGVEAGDRRRRHPAGGAGAGVAGAERIQQRYGIEASVLDDGKVRLEREAGHRFVTDVVEAFPGEIDAISIAKPTLEDVFIHRTGHRFWTEEDASKLAESSKAKKKR